MSSTTLAVSYCWHCHSPLEHATQGFKNPARSEAVAECLSCGSQYRIVCAMQAVSGPAVQTFEAATRDLLGAARSRFESGRNGRPPKGGL
jgi:RNase P subunit RPR2